MPPIVIVNGNKGGVGKSLVSMALLDALTVAGNTIHLVDCDTGNPDVYKAYCGTMPAEALNLDTEDGWILLLDLVHAHPDAVFVLNSPARSNDGVKRYGDLLTTALPQLGRRLVTLWVLDETIDAVASAVTYRQCIRSSAFHFVRNLGKVPVDKFGLLDTTRVKKEVEAEGGLVLDFPALAQRVAMRLRNDRLSIAGAESVLSFGERIELLRWRERVGAALAPMLERCLASETAKA